MKTLNILFAVLALGVFTACDEDEDEGNYNPNEGRELVTISFSNPGVSVEKEQLLGGRVLSNEEETYKAEYTAVELYENNIKVATGLFDNYIDSFDAYLKGDALYRMEVKQYERSNELYGFYGYSDKIRLPYAGSYKEFVPTKELVYNDSPLVPVGVMNGGTTIYFEENSAKLDDDYETFYVSHEWHGIDVGEIWTERYKNAIEVNVEHWCLKDQWLELEIDNIQMLSKTYEIKNDTSFTRGFAPLYIDRDNTVKAYIYRIVEMSNGELVRTLEHTETISLSRLEKAILNINLSGWNDGERTLGILVKHEEYQEGDVIDIEL